MRKLLIILIVLICGIVLLGQIKKPKNPQAIGCATKNAPCVSKWWKLEAGFYSSGKTNDYYFGLFPGHCTAVSGLLNCYWRTPREVCKAWIIDVVQFAPDLYPKLTYKSAKSLLNAPDPQNDWACDFTYEYTDGNGNKSIEHQGTKITRVEVGEQEVSDLNSYCNTTMVVGKYKNCPDDFSYCGNTYTEGKEGLEYTTAQRNKILQVNKANNNGKIKSDLVGFEYPCFVNNKPTTCKEPEFLNEKPYKADSAEIHHVVPKKSVLGCNCGKNSMANAAVISRQLNRYFTNNKRPANEVNAINSAGMNPYPCSSLFAPSANKSLKINIFNKKRIKNH